MIIHLLLFSDYPQTENRALCKTNAARL